MKKLLLIFLLLPTLTQAQSYRYTRAEIIHEADSILKSFIGQEKFSYCINELNTDDFIYYRYTDKKGRIKYDEVPLHHRLTRDDFKDVKVWYTFKYPYPKCMISDTVRGETSVTLGKNLEMKRSPDISFIPDYVWEQDSCTFTIRH